LFVFRKICRNFVPKMETSAIEIRDLTLGYRVKNQEKPIASGLQTTIQQGKLTCLLGANGVGKSTLLRTLTGFQPPLGGQISIFGKNIREYSGKSLSRTVGIVLTEKISVRDMSVRDLIALGRNPYTGFWGRLGRRDMKLVDEAVRRIKIETLAARSIHTLSDGERQKVMIAKALAQETPIIVLDEPTAFLDFRSKIEIMLLLCRLTREEGKTVLLSTHDVELALQVADQLRLMDGRRGLIAGSPAELHENGELERFFSCEGVAFDSDKGFFRIDKNYFL